MYSNVGRVLKILAAVVCAIGIFSSVIGGFSIMAIDEDLVGPGFLTIIFGSLLSWLSTLSLYGFGVLIENSDDTTQSCKNMEYKLDVLIKLMAADQKNQVPPSANESHQWRCPICGQTISTYPCPHCGYHDQNDSVSAPQEAAHGTWSCKRCGQVIDHFPCKHCGASAIPIRVFRQEDGTLTCPTCNTVQNSMNYHCMTCGQAFINHQPYIPYWCGTCGTPGPYVKECPTCGSSIKLMNN